MAPVAVTRAEFGDVARLARVVAVAVFDLPVSGFLIPDEDDRRRVSAEVARLVYLWPALAGGVLWCTADRMAVAGWLRHNPGRVAEPHPQAAVELRRLVGRWYPRFERLAELLHEVHAPLRPSGVSGCGRAGAGRLLSAVRLCGDRRSGAAAQPGDPAPDVAPTNDTPRRCRPGRRRRAGEVADGPHGQRTARSAAYRGRRADVAGGGALVSGVD